MCNSFILKWVSLTRVMFIEPQVSKMGKVEGCEKALFEMSWLSQQLTILSLLNGSFRPWACLFMSNCSKVVFSLQFISNWVHWSVGVRGLLFLFLFFYSGFLFFLLEMGHFDPGHRCVIIKKSQKKKVIIPKALSLFILPPVIFNAYIWTFWSSFTLNRVNLTAT